MKQIRAILNEKFAERKSKNPSYSLRAFARDLEIFPSHLSRLLKGNAGLSATSAQKIAAKLSLSIPETQKFCGKFDAPYQDALSKKTAALSQTKPIYKKIELDTYKWMAEWHHSAILELHNLDDYQGSAEWIAKKINISVSKARIAMKRLVRIGQATMEGGEFRPLFLNRVSPTDVPSAALRRCNRDLLSKAVDSLKSMPVTKRNIVHFVFAMDSAQLAEFKNRVHNFFFEIIAEFEQSKTKDAVHCVNFTCFPLTEDKQ